MEMDPVLQVINYFVQKQRNIAHDVADLIVEVHDPDPELQLRVAKVVRSRMENLARNKK